MDILDDDIEQAEQRMSRRLAATPHAIEARYDRRVSRIVVRLSNGLELAFPPHLAEGLSHAKSDDLAAIEISPSGLGLHWPTLDADLYVPSLMEGVFGSPRWMAALDARERRNDVLKGDTGTARQPSGTNAPSRKRTAR